MWKESVFREIARRTGYEVEEVERLLSLFFGKNGIRKPIRQGDKVFIKGFMTLFQSKRYIYRKNMRLASRRLKEAKKKLQLKEKAKRRKKKKKK